MFCMRFFSLGGGGGCSSSSVPSFSIDPHELHRLAGGGFGISCQAWPKGHYKSHSCYAHPLLYPREVREERDTGYRSPLSHHGSATARAHLQAEEILSNQLGIEDTLRRHSNFFGQTNRIQIEWWLDCDFKKWKQSIFIFQVQMCKSRAAKRLGVEWVLLVVWVTACVYWKLF